MPNSAFSFIGGLYSLLGTGEWTMTNRNINYQEYAKLANAFYPHDFDAAEWGLGHQNPRVRGYVCFTTRHHDGFSMFPHGAAALQHRRCHAFRPRRGEGVGRRVSPPRTARPLLLLADRWWREDAPRGRTGLGTGRPAEKEDADAYFDFMRRSSPNC